MKAQELRIGNFVNIEHEANDFEYVHVVQQLMSTEALIKCNEESDWCNYEHLQGTQLTEEWLLKAGFEKEQFNVYFKDPIRLALLHDSCLFLFNSGYIYIKYVHQLQNLYFTLKGKELEFNE